MNIHITNIYGQSFTSTALKAQNRAAETARTMGCKELGIYSYDMDSDSPEALHSRIDGIIASVGYGDVVIFQYPAWNSTGFDEAFVHRLKQYKGLKLIIFAHDIPSLMFENNRYLLSRQIAILNQAESVILPSQGMADFLASQGMTVKKTVIQKMWDFPVPVDSTITPEFRKVIHFAGDPESWKFGFVKEWKYDQVELRVTAQKGDWAEGKNISFLGWFNDDIFLADALRKGGGFGLVWTDHDYWSEYMALNANYKISAYLAAGLPVIVNNRIAEKETIIRKNLGMAVDSLDEAVSRVENMSKAQYHKMTGDVALFSNLIRENYFTKRLLADAIFELLCG